MLSAMIYQPSMLTRILHGLAILKRKMLRIQG